MSSTPDAESETLHARVESWLGVQMPIIQNHGGTSAVRKADPDDGEVVIELGGTCSGCGISPITADNIERELLREFPEVTDVTVRFADTGGSQWETEQRESVMGIDLTEGGRGDWGGSNESDHF